MKSCLGLLIVLLVFVAVVGGGVLIWHLSSTAEFTRKPLPAAQGAPPRAVPVKPQPPKAR